MSQTLTDQAASSNPEKATKLRILQGDFLSSSDEAARVFFMSEDLSWEGDLGKAILEEVGPQLDEYILENVIQPKRGEAYFIPADVGNGHAYIIGILPLWDGGMNDEERALKKCITGILETAEANGLRSLAFPALGMGKKDYPVRKAARLILSVLTPFPYKTLRDLSVVCKTLEIFEAYSG
ncbi:MAG TPA: macro domain-containing protein [Alphaproteobacteria bacterium]|nr:macro domain-containing protein [Alphaproteobacteria bacterium]HNS44521.1 macro domain-containing protein [Alphaproteobacteria bacterium]